MMVSYRYLLTSRIAHHSSKEWYDLTCEQLQYAGWGSTSLWHPFRCFHRLNGSFNLCIKSSKCRRVSLFLSLLLVVQMCPFLRCRISAPLLGSL